MRRAVDAGPVRAPVRGPVRLLDVELGLALDDVEPLTPVFGGAYEELRILVRLHRRPLGMLSVRLFDGCLDAGLMADAIWVELAGAIRDHCRRDGMCEPEKLTADGLPHAGRAEPPCSWRRSAARSAARSADAGADLPRATIVITTCGGDGRRLEDTVHGALAQSYPNFEVVVVDNRPGASGVPGALAAFAHDGRVRYAAEGRPGLSHARNRGAAVAAGGIVAFTDDDVVLDPDWLGCLVGGFDDPRVACVTGLILPLELETSAQRLLEEFGGYSKGFAPRTWDLDRNRPDNPLYPYTVGAFGSGANAAFRAPALAALGGFAGCLGAGTLARGGEDLDLYVTCVQRGYRINYEPAAIVRHAHLREMEQVRGKVRDYGVGLGAMLTKHLVQSPATAAALLSRVPRGLVHLLSAASPKNAGRSRAYPPSLVRAELRGLVYGPVAYGRSRRAS